MKPARRSPRFRLKKQRRRPLVYRFHAAEGSGEAGGTRRPWMRGGREREGLEGEGRLAFPFLPAAYARARWAAPLLNARLLLRLRLRPSLTFCRCGAPACSGARERGKGEEKKKQASVSTARPSVWQTAAQLKKKTKAKGRREIREICERERESDWRGREKKERREKREEEREQEHSPIAPSLSHARSKPPAERLTLAERRPALLRHPPTASGAQPSRLRRSLRETQATKGQSAAKGRTGARSSPAGHVCDANGTTGGSVGDGPEISLRREVPQADGKKDGDPLPLPRSSIIDHVVPAFSGASSSRPRTAAAASISTHCGVSSPGSPHTETHPWSLRQWRLFLEKEIFAGYPRVTRALAPGAAIARGI